MAFKMTGPWLKSALKHNTQEVFGKEEPVGPHSHPEEKEPGVSIFDKESEPKSAYPPDHPFYGGEKKRKVSPLKSANHGPDRPGWKEEDVYEGKAKSKKSVPGAHMVWHAKNKK